MRSETIEQFLEELASGATPRSGGGAAALGAAHAAALLAMVARRSRPARGSGHADVLVRARDTGDALRGIALDLADADARAAGAVARARALPSATDTEQDIRSDAVAGALTEAGRVAARVIAVAERVLTVAETLRTVADGGVPGGAGGRGGGGGLAGIAAAAEAVRAATGTARVEVELALAGITEPTAREELLDALDPVDDLVLRAAKVTAAVREQILR